MKTTKNLFPWFAVTVAVIMWGLSFLSIKVTVTALPVMTQAFIRHVIALVVLSFMKFKMKSAVKLNKRDIPLFTIAGLLGITIYFYFENSGMQRISASSASMIIAIIPILTIIADSIVFKERLTKKKVLSVIISFIGIYFIVGSSRSNNNEFLGYFMMIGAAISWVTYTLVTKSLFEKYSHLTIVYYQTIAGTVTLLPFALFEKTDLSLINTSVVLNLVFLGVFCSAIALYLYIVGMNHIGVGICSLMMNLIPVVAIIASFIILKEEITATQLIGGLFVISAVCISSFKSSNKTISVQKNDSAG